MASPLTDTRVQTLAAVLADTDEQRAVSAAVRSSERSWLPAFETLKATLPSDSLRRVALAHEFAIITSDHPGLDRPLVDDPVVVNMRDVALNFNVSRLAELADLENLDGETPGETDEERRQSFGVGVRRQLFDVAPTAVLQRMVQDSKISIQDRSVRSGVVSFPEHQPHFDVYTTSEYLAFREPQAFQGIATDVIPAVVEHLKTLQRPQGISPIPEVVPRLMEAQLTSAFSVAQLTESTFLQAHGSHLGEENAQQAYTKAINSAIRNESALMQMRAMVSGSGLAVCDGETPQEARLAELQAVTVRSQVPLNLSDPFGGIHYSECEDCQSVYSAAAYCVEILRYPAVRFAELIDYLNNQQPAGRETRVTYVHDRYGESIAKVRPGKLSSHAFALERGSSSRLESRIADHFDKDTGILNEHNTTLWSEIPADKSKAKIAFKFQQLEKALNCVQIEGSKKLCGTAPKSRRVRMRRAD